MPPVIRAGKDAARGLARGPGAVVAGSGPGAVVAWPRAGRGSGPAGRRAR